MMKRLMLVLAVGVLLVAMIMATAIPAFAKGNPTGKENPHAEFDEGTITVGQQCAPGVGGCDPPGEDDGFGEPGPDAKGGDPGRDSNFDVCPGSGKDTQNC